MTSLTIAHFAPQGGAALAAAPPATTSSPTGRRHCPCLLPSPQRPTTGDQGSAQLASPARRRPRVDSDGCRRRRRPLRAAGAPPAHPSRWTAHAAAPAAGDRDRGRASASRTSTRRRTSPLRPTRRRRLAAQQQQLVAEDGSSALSSPASNRPSGSSPPRRRWACVPRAHWAHVVASPAPRDRIATRGAAHSSDTNSTLQQLVGALAGDFGGSGTGSMNPRRRSVAIGAVRARACVQRRPRRPPSRALARARVSRHGDRRLRPPRPDPGDPGQVAAAQAAPSRTPRRSRCTPPAA